MAWFQIVQPGTASYAAGGFTIAVPGVEKIESASLRMTPETLLASTLLVGLELTYQANTATVKVFKYRDWPKGALPDVWREVADATNLLGANFILTGKGY